MESELKDIQKRLKQTTEEKRKKGRVANVTLYGKEWRWNKEQEILKENQERDERTMTPAKKQKTKREGTWR